jgi:SAM-dependent methyltransferase
VPYDRDVQAFNDRATSYEAGRLGQLHRDFADRAVRIALAVAPGAERVLDVGSGTGYALRRLAEALPGAQELTGVDAAPDMVRVANEASGAGRGGRGRRAARQDDRARRARDRARIDDSSQPRMVARFSHHCISEPSATFGSGYQLAR